ncbi:MAG TPA: fumarylacetoacetate hydrolase family protein [Sphingobium sp.]
MKLVSIDAMPGARTGVLIGDSVLDFARAEIVLPLAGWVPCSMPRLLAAGEHGLDIIRRLIDAVESGHSDEAERLKVAGALTPVEEVKLAPSVPRPGILLSHGRAYRSHLDEMATKTDLAKSIPEEPKAFLKNVNSLLATEAPIMLPPQCADMVDFEAEFSIVFGRDCHNVAPEEAMEAVAGYTIMHDVSARDWVATNDWDLNRMGKQLPTFAPLGPVITTKDEMPDPHNLQLTTRVNGETMQLAHTKDLIWRIPDLISFFSRWYPFRAGDILTTGSPAGVGFARNPPVFLKAGDVVEITVDGIGTLRNPVAAAEFASWH